MPAHATQWCVYDMGWRGGINPRFVSLTKAVKCASHAWTAAQINRMGRTRKVRSSANDEIQARTVISDRFANFGITLRWFPPAESSSGNTKLNGMEIKNDNGEISDSR
jgi:hypothetical protein